MVVPEGVVLRTVFARVSDSASLLRIDLVSEGTMQACALLTALLSVVLSVALGQRWFGSYFTSDCKTSSGCRGFL